MIVISSRNVEHALSDALYRLRGDFVTSDSRNGPVIRFPEPVTTVYHQPMERVIFDEVRDANPFLHFFESLWMLAGQNDLDFLSKFTKNMANFSDDGRTLNGAYGHRWRYHFGDDQLLAVVRLLRKDPDSRRAVISMWDGHKDLWDMSSKDLPCNTSVMFKIRQGYLDMTVTNRSNDIVWGCYGANAVHFSYLMQFVAESVGVKIGKYRQVSDDLHLYPEIAVQAKLWQRGGFPVVNRYGPIGSFEVTPLLGEGQTPADFLREVASFVFHPNSNPSVFVSPTLKYIACPLFNAYQLHKTDAPKEIQEAAYQFVACPAWLAACLEWVNRRRETSGKTPLFGV